MKAGPVCVCKGVSCTLLKCPEWDDLWLPNRSCSGGVSEDTSVSIIIIVFHYKLFGMAQQRCKMGLVYN